MKKSKEAKLKKHGWKIGLSKDLLGLSDEEAAYVELKASLSEHLRRKRVAKRLTQHDLARKLRSSQFRIGKMEKGDPTVSIDLLMRSLFVLGT